MKILNDTGYLYILTTILAEISLVTLVIIGVRKIITNIVTTQATEPWWYPTEHYDGIRNNLLTIRGTRFPGSLSKVAEFEAVIARNNAKRDTEAYTGKWVKGKNGVLKPLHSEQQTEEQFLDYIGPRGGKRYRSRDRRTITWIICGCGWEDGVKLGHRINVICPWCKETIIIKRSRRSKT